MCLIFDICVIQTMLFYPEFSLKSVFMPGFLSLESLRYLKPGVQGLKYNKCYQDSDSGINLTVLT